MTRPPSTFERIARRILRHGIDPLGDPRALLAAEGLRLAWGWTPGRHGLHYDDTIILSPTGDRLERRLAVHHERAHAHLWRLGIADHTEADVVYLTAELAYPSWIRREGKRLPQLPPWIMRIIG